MSHKRKRIPCIVVLSAVCVALSGYSAGAKQAGSDDGFMAKRKASPIPIRLNRTASARGQALTRHTMSDAATLPLGETVSAPPFIDLLEKLLSRVLPALSALGAPKGRAPPSA